MLTIGCSSFSDEGLSGDGGDGVVHWRQYLCVLYAQPGAVARQKTLTWMTWRPCASLWSKMTLACSWLMPRIPITPAPLRSGRASLPWEAMAEDLQRMEALPGNYYNFHPGAHVGQGSDAGIQMIVNTLCQVMFEGQQTTVLLETMAGKGTEVGRSFEELARIIEGAAARRPELSDKLGVCLDTCHVSDAGYDIIHDLDGVLDEFDRVVGIDRLRAVHINDSKNPCGAHKDRHECIGKGYLGSEEFGGGMQVMQIIVSNSRLRALPFILETPNELAGYAARNQTFKVVTAVTTVTKWSVPFTLCDCFNQFSNCRFALTGA